MNYDKLSILNICHYDKYKVFNVTDHRSNTLFRVSGVGEELPYEALRRMNVVRSRCLVKNVLDTKE